MKIIYIDMDGVITDFEEGRKKHPLGTISPYIGRPDKLPNLYKNLQPIKDSIESVNKILNDSRFDLYFLSTAPWDNPDAWTHKRLWIAKYFNEKKIRKKLILCSRKDLLKGDYLIDDRPFNGASKFEGEWINFGGIKYPTWKNILDYLEVK